MGYKVELPPDIEPSGLQVSLPKKTGDSGDSGDRLALRCVNCGAPMTQTSDIHGKALFECRACAVGDGTDRPNGVVGDDASVVDQIFEDGEILAVLICSPILENHIWLAFSDDFDPKDGQAVFYARELEFLRDKTPEQLREIHKVKVAFGPGSRTRQ